MLSPDSDMHVQGSGLQHSDANGQQPPNRTWAAGWVRSVVLDTRVELRVEAGARSSSSSRAHSAASRAC